MSKKPRPDLDERVDPRLRAFMAPSVAKGNPFDILVNLPLADLRATLKTAHGMLQARALGVVPSEGLKITTIDIDVPGSCLQ